MSEPQCRVYGCVRDVGSVPPFCDHCAATVPGPLRLRLRVTYALYVKDGSDKAHTHFQQAVGDALDHIAQERANAEA